jgi:GDPmannose 4,6-dehydratase
MDNQRISLITGATSMDGKTMAHLLLSKGYKVILTYRTNAHLNLNDIKDLYIDDLINYPDSSLDFVFMEITDQTSIKLAIRGILENPKYGRIDEFYNFASQSQVWNSFKNPSYTMLASGISMFYILEAIKELTPKTRVWQACTSEMFGGDPKNCPFDENSKFETRSPYAVAKKVSYDWVTYFRQTYGMFVCAAFCFNHSNIYRNPTFMIQKACLGATRIALGKETEITFGNLNFERDESYSDFCVEAFWKMLQLDKPEDFVIGRGESFSGEQFLQNAFGYFNLNWQKYVKQDKSLFRDNEVVRLVSNPQKAIKKLQWSPDRMSFKDHIRLMCEHDYLLESGEKAPRKDVLKMFPNPLDKS